MDENRVSESAVATSQVMIPQDANPSGNVHGGVIMKLIDTAAGVVARRHTRCNAVSGRIAAIRGRDYEFSLHRFAEHGHAGKRPHGYERISMRFPPFEKGGFL